MGRDANRTAGCLAMTGLRERASGRIGGSAPTPAGRSVAGTRTGSQSLWAIAAGMSESQTDLLLAVRKVVAAFDELVSSTWLGVPLPAVFLASRARQPTRISWRRCMVGTPVRLSRNSQIGRASCRERV